VVRKGREEGRETEREVCGRRQRVRGGQGQRVRDSVCGWEGAEGERREERKRGTKERRAGMCTVRARVERKGREA
jgi:hypothetical protein